MELSETKKNIVRWAKLLFIQTQCTEVLKAYCNMQKELQNLDVNEFWQSAARLVNSAALISKTLWGKSNDPLWVQLKAELEVTENMEIKNKQIRNSFEHFDERLDEWEKKSENGVLIDGNIGPVDSIKVAGANQESELLSRLRHFDPSTGIISFFGKEFSVPKVAEEAALIRKNTQKLMPKIFW
ncbi:MAG: hypothetical protein Q4A92_07215 [Corynebacterium sp.]|nr:hypothetical protein [Corynebacterium sp.]